jgi:hypothetical protein
MAGLEGCENSLPHGDSIPVPCRYTDYANPPTPLIIMVMKLINLINVMSNKRQFLAAIAI